MLDQRRLERGKVDPQIIGVEVAMAANITECGQVFRRALRDLAKDKPPVTPTPGKMTAFGIRLHSIGHLHKKWKFLRSEVAEELVVQPSAEVVRVGDEGIFEPAV